MNRTTADRTRAAGPPLGVVEVWFVPLVPPVVPLATFAAVLDPREQAHANRMRVGGDAWAAAHGALRIVLAHHLRQPASALRFKGTAGHKPELDQLNAPRYSLSHTEGLALIALASDREVGVDVERENDATDIDALTREFLQPADLAMVSSAAPEARRKAFFAAWTRHEARAKLRGHALEGAAPEQAGSPGGLILVRALKVPAGFAAAVAAEGGNWTVNMRSVAEALVGTE